MCSGKTVAIECDGERWHSGDVKIREDMERQTILERLGWRFIRIRGSEYYRAPQQTIERVIRELAQYGIEPEDAETVVSDDRNTELLLRIKNRAAAILASESVGEGDNAAAVEAALNPRLLEELRQDSEQKALSPKKSVVSEPCIPARQKQPSENQVRKPEKPASKKTKGKETLSTSHKQPAILREPILVPGISGPEMVSKADKQQVIPGMEDVLPEDDDIITLLKKNGVRFVDKRKNNGSLWLIGGSELKPIVNKAKKLGINFRFKEDGGKATKGAPGWWGK